MLLMVLTLVLFAVVFARARARARRRDPTWQMEQDIERWRRLRSIR